MHAEFGTTYLSPEQVSIRSATPQFSQDNHLLPSPIEESEQTVESMQEQLPSWQESALQLTPAQRIAADMKFTQLTVRALNRKANRIHMLAQADSGEFVQPDSDERTKSIFGIIERLEAVEQGQEAIRRYDLLWGEEGIIYTDIVRKSLPLLENRRNEIYAQAASWDETDLLNVVSDTQALVNNLPKEQQSYLLNRVGLTPESFKERLLRRKNKVATKAGEIGGTLIANGGSIAALELWCFGSGLVGEHVGSLEKIPPVMAGNIDLRYAVGAGITLYSYKTWLKDSIHKAANAQFKLHKKFGISTSITGKLADEIMSDEESSPGQDLSTSVVRSTENSGQFFDLSEEPVSEADAEKNFRRGYRMQEIAKELIYYIYAGNEMRNGSYLDAMTFIAIANFAAAAYEAGIIGMGTEFLLDPHGQKERLAQKFSSMKKSVNIYDKDKQVTLP